ncbi:hypothetical protein Scep_022471 [Stephania cephalantha]|uniref:Uncharacterized protein n=1 Tax=Stephania cephalantha TaxID=152367 RepID=A0AAP0I0Z7_9MAGN
MNLEARLSFDEEDVFYSDLRRRILILTSDDDDEEQGTLLAKPRTDVVNVSGGVGGGFGYWRHDHHPCVVNNPVLFVEMDVGRLKSAGTGVFIPQIRTSSVAATAQSAPMRKDNSSTGGRMKCRSRPASQKRRS